MVHSLIRIQTIINQIEWIFIKGSFQYIERIFIYTINTKYRKTIHVKIVINYMYEFYEMKDTILTFSHKVYRSLDTTNVFID